MWIRTECGIITNKFRFSTEDKTIIKLVKDGLVSSRILFVKKQGDNLIDVLEWEDLIIGDDGFIYTIVAYMFENDKLIDKSMQSVSEIWKEINISEIDFDFKVITHEQFMPLAQEVTK